MRALLLRTLVVMAVVTGLATAVGGCSTIPASLYDFTGNKAEVGVPFGIGGPSLESARVQALPVGREHCQSLGKTATPVSARRRITGEFSGEYIFLFRCEGADRVTID